MKNEILTNVRKIQRSCGFQTINKPCFLNILWTNPGIKNEAENDIFSGHFNTAIKEGKFQN